MLTKDNINIVYLLIVVFIVYIFAIKAKETIDNVALNDYTEEQLRLTINKAFRSKEKLESLLKMEEPPEFIRKRIGELKEDVKNGEEAKEVLISRGIYV